LNAGIAIKGPEKSFKTARGPGQRKSKDRSDIINDGRKFKFTGHLKLGGEGDKAESRETGRKRKKGVTIGNRRKNLKRGENFGMGFVAEGKKKAEKDGRVEGENQVRQNKEKRGLEKNLSKKQRKH